MMRLWLPMLDWDQRCMTNDRFLNVNFYTVSYIGMVGYQLTLNLVSRRSFALIQTFISMCFLHIGGIRMGASTCDISIVETFI